MAIPYFPGCTLSTKASGYDRSGRAAAAALGLSLEELDEWQCCGATFPLAVDNSLALAAPARLLAQAQQAGDRLTTLCAICFHVLRRSQHFFDQHPETLERLNLFTEEPYTGGAQVTHFLELLRDEITWEGLHKQVIRPLKGLRLAPYYGCLLLRPQDEIGLDNPDDPHILHDCLASLGCEAVHFPYEAECCGAYLTVSQPDLPDQLAKDILTSARRAGAQALVTACPLCQFNLDYPQRSESDQINGDGLPILYFTQPLAVALGLEPAAWGMEGHYIDPRPLFQQKVEG